MTLFVDTSGLYAVLDRDDGNHRAARRAWERILSGTDPMLTTNYVLLESLALVQHRLGMAAVRSLVTAVLPCLDLEWVSPEDHDSAVAALLVSDRRRLSLVDCSSFQVMRRLGLAAAFTFDRHFADQGFTRVPS